MLELRLPAENAEFRGDLGLSMSMIGGRIIHEVTAWKGSEQSLSQRLDQMRAEGCEVVDVAPGRYWTFDYDWSSHASGDFAVVDISNHQSLIRLVGVQARNVLKKGLPVDLHESAFPDGVFFTSMIDGMTASIHRRDDSIDVYCQRSYARSVWEWLTDAALEFE